MSAEPRDDAPTPHPFGEPDVPLGDEYTEHRRREAEAELERERCELGIPGYFAEGRADGVCGRPAGHEGDCWPAPLAGDEEGEHG